MVPVGVYSCLLFLFTSHLVLARNGCPHENNTLECATPSNFLCQLVKRNLQPCERDSTCPCGGRCCFLGCGDYCWPPGESHVPPVPEISSNGVTTERDKRSIVNVQTLSATPLSYVQTPATVGGTYGSALPAQISDGRQQPIVILPPSYPANVPNRFDPYPTFLENQAPVPPPVAEFVIVGTNKTLKLVRSDAADSNGMPVKQKQYPPFTVEDSSKNVLMDLEPKSGQIVDFPIKSSKLDDLIELQLSSAADSQSNQDEKARRKLKKIEILKKALKQLGFNNKIADRLRHQKILEKFLKMRPTKVKMNFHLRVKNGSDPRMTNDLQSPVVIEGNTYDFLGRKGRRIPYSWTFENRTHTTSNSEGLVDKNAVESELDVYIWYNKEPKQSYQSSVPEFKQDIQRGVEIMHGKDELPDIDAERLLPDFVKPTETTRKYFDENGSDFVQDNKDGYRDRYEKEPHENYQVPSNKFDSQNAHNSENLPKKRGHYIVDKVYDNSLSYHGIKEDSRDKDIVSPSEEVATKLPPQRIDDFQQKDVFSKPDDPFTTVYDDTTRKDVPQPPIESLKKELLQEHDDNKPNTDSPTKAQYAEREDNKPNIDPPKDAQPSEPNDNKPNIDPPKETQPPERDDNKPNIDPLKEAHISEHDGNKQENIYSPSDEQSTNTRPIGQFQEDHTELPQKDIFETQISKPENKDLQTEVEKVSVTKPETSRDTNAPDEKQFDSTTKDNKDQPISKPPEAELAKNSENKSDKDNQAPKDFKFNPRFRKPKSK